MRPSAAWAFVLVGVLVLSGLALVTTARPGAPAAEGVLPPLPENAPAPAGGTNVTVAPGYVLGEGDRVLGPVNGSSTLDVAVGLPPRDPSGLADYLDLLYAPGSPVYHHYLTPAQLATRYGASDSDVKAALTYFAQRGLVARETPDGLMVEVSGAAATVAGAFHTSFDTVATGPGTTMVTHLTPAVLPSSVPVTGVLGLGNVTELRPDVAAGAPPTAVAGPAAGCAGGSPLSPCQVWGAYDLADDLANGTDGSGFTLAVVDTYDSSETQTDLASDLASFDTQFGLPAAGVHYLYPLPTSVDLNTTGSSGWGLEEALDLEWSHATAPGATIDMTFSPNSGIGLYEAVDALVANDRANVISLSWGEPDVGTFNSFETPCSEACNASTDGSYAILSPVLQFAAAEGISVFAATGDCGAADGTSGVATNYPASDPYVTGVGGTHLSVSSSGVYIGETGWGGNQSGAHSPGCENQGGSGGGYSPLPRPAWQTGPGLSAGSTRADPDVAAISAPGVLIQEHGETSPVEGTSVATPIWAGIAAVADQAHGAPLGFLDPGLYRILDNSTLYARDFHDVTTGNNGYAAGSGWDPVTGIGSPVVGALLPDLAGHPIGVSDLVVTLGASATSGPAPLSVSFSEGVSGGSGSYPIQGVYFGDGTAGPVASGTAQHVYSFPGVYAATGYVWDSSANVSDSVPIAIVVGVGSTLSVGLNASATTIAPGVADTLTASVAGGLAPYAYDFSFGDGSFLNDSASAWANHTYAAPGGYCAVVIVSDSAAPPDGGESAPVAISVGGAPAPTCSVDRGTLSLTAETDVPVRDAPADFPGLFQVTGGIGGFSETFASTDPYIAPCGCTIFRAAGTYSVSVFVNATGGIALHAETNVTVAPPLALTVTPGPLEGGPPLLVPAHVVVNGGFGANWTVWTSGAGGDASGPWVNFTYASAGDYWLVAHAEDEGSGNASWAGLVQVSADPALSISATIGPVVDIDSGTTIRFQAGTTAGEGIVAVNWQLGSAASAYGAVALQTYYAPPAGTDSASLAGSLNVSVLGGTSLSVPFAFSDLFAVESGGFTPAADALVLEDTTSPGVGVAPYDWTGNASISGPGATEISWQIPTASPPLDVAGPFATFDLGPGEFAEITTASNSAGDTAVDERAVTVSGGPLTIHLLVVNASGLPPFGREIIANATGGVPPYWFGWQFGDGNSTNSTTVSGEEHTFPGPGTYDVRVEVVDSVGAMVEDTVVVVISGSSGAAAPPALTFDEILAVTLAAAGAGAVGIAVIARRRGRPPTVNP